MCSELLLVEFWGGAREISCDDVMQCKHPLRVSHKSSAAVERKKHFSSVSAQAKSENANEHFGIIVANSRQQQRSAAGAAGEIMRFRSSLRHAHIYTLIYIYVTGAGSNLWPPLRV